MDKLTANSAKFIRLILAHKKNVTQIGRVHIIQTNIDKKTHPHAAGLKMGLESTRLTQPWATDGASESSRLPWTMR